MPVIADDELARMRRDAERNKRLNDNATHGLLQRYADDPEAIAKIKVFAEYPSLPTDVLALLDELAETKQRAVAAESLVESHEAVLKAEVVPRRGLPSYLFYD